MGAQPAPSFLVSPTSLDFPPTQVYRRSPPQQLIVTNTGSEPLSFQFLAFDLPLQVTGCTESVTPSQSCTAEVVFAPTAGGPQFGEGRLIVFPSAGESQTLPVTARWLPLVPDPVPPLDFGPVQDGTTSGPGRCRCGTSGPTTPRSRSDSVSERALGERELSDRNLGLFTAYGDPF